MTIKNSNTNHVSEPVLSIKQVGIFTKKNVEAAYRNTQNFINKKENKKTILTVLGVLSCGTVLGVAYKNRKK